MLLAIPAWFSEMVTRREGDADAAERIGKDAENKSFWAGSSNPFSSGFQKGLGEAIGSWTIKLLILGAVLLVAYKFFNALIEKLAGKVI